MRLIGNIIWCLTGGWLTALMWLVFGVLCCVTVVGIPFGIQCFKCMTSTKHDSHIGHFIYLPIRNIQVGERITFQEHFMHAFYVLCVPVGNIQSSK